MGIIASVISQQFPPKSKFQVQDIPDLTGKVVIVTGGNAGIGKETVKALLEHNAKVYVAARNKWKAEEAIRDLEMLTGKEAIFLPLDLADFSSIRRAAEEFLSKENTLHILFNNGGVMACPIDQLTKDGYDLQFGTNVLGHFFFTELLMHALFNVARSSPGEKARVVTTSSLANYFGDLDWDTFTDTPARKKKGTQFLYSQSKFGNVVVARELARRYGDQGILSFSLHPGSIKTNLFRHLPNIIQSVMNLVLHDVSYGALTQLYAGTSPDVVDLNGRVLLSVGKIKKAQPKSTRSCCG
ncbi:NAD(P)-binding protein [Rickenella mellea]|uniref:NAD(P)-binding protein n=1 Tax=Rickenella mellea TaxID=50990 RepID=A0A4Y7PZK7_9AGAM|nr:NAD(P)-binding protein [Rickenella mellea]